MATFPHVEPWRSAIHPRPMIKGEETLIVDLLSRVFQDDPLMRFLVAEQEAMLERPRRFYEANLRLCQQNGRVDVLPDMQGVCMWLPPGKTDIGFRQLLQSGLLRATVGMGLKSIRRFYTMYRVVEPIAKKATVDPCWILHMIAVDPASQDQGLGGSLIRPVLEEADSAGVNCFLESGNERNLSFYLRRGFEVAEEVQVPDGPRVWGMLRRPSSPEA